MCMYERKDGGELWTDEVWLGGGKEVRSKGKFDRSSSRSQKKRTKRESDETFIIFPFSYNVFSMRDYLATRTSNYGQDDNK